MKTEGRLATIANRPFFVSWVRVEVHAADSLPTFKADFDGRLQVEWTSTDGSGAGLRSGGLSVTFFR